MSAPEHKREIDHGGSRVTCLTCLRNSVNGSTAIRWEWMNDVQWKDALALFDARHPLAAAQQEERTNG